MMSSTVGPTILITDSVGAWVQTPIQACRSSEAIDGSSAAPAPAPAAAAPPSFLNEAVLWLFSYVDSTFNPKQEQQEAYHRFLSHGKNI
ncbi:hypothetical protein K1719_042629 [Acacia pycnantha]|nr:hypothetical protein K1719_042629 [Acacia pycnantha]